MTTASTVTVGFNNQITAHDAAKALSCSYSHTINLLRTKKLKGQMKEGHWFVDHDDLQRAIATKLVKRRWTKTKQAAPAATSNVRALRNNQISTLTPSKETVDVKIAVPRDKFELVNMVLGRKDATLVGILNAKIDDVYSQIMGQLKTVRV